MENNTYCRTSNLILRLTFLSIANIQINQIKHKVWPLFLCQTDALYEVKKTRQKKLWMPMFPARETP